MHKGTLKSPQKASQSSWIAATARLRKLRPVPRRFYDRSPELVAPELLGKVLIRRQGRKLLAGGLKALTSGPARLCEALGITRTRDDGKDLASATSDLYIAGAPSAPGQVHRGPRVGITQAADWPLRFYLVGSPFVSGPKTKAK